MTIKLSCSAMCILEVVVGGQVCPYHCAGVVCAPLALSAWSLTPHMLLFKQLFTVWLCPSTVSSESIRYQVALNFNPTWFMLFVFYDFHSFQHQSIIISVTHSQNGWFIKLYQVVSHAGMLHHCWRVSCLICGVSYMLTKPHWYQIHLANINLFAVSQNCVNIKITKNEHWLWKPMWGFTAIYVLR